MIQEATIQTDKAERIMKTVCNHFARKTTASYEGNKGYVEFGDGKCEITVTSNTMLLQLSADNVDNLSRVQNVVVKHLLRFAPGENLQINWSEPA